MAMLNDKNTEQLQELVTCAICLEYYKDPRILPCSHTFCLKCIQQLVGTDTAVCPFRDNTAINQNDIGQLPINRTAKDMVEFIMNFNPSLNTNSNTLCDNCNEKQALNWCEKCAFHYCESCTKSVHSIKALKSHTIVPASEKPHSLCLEHSDEKYKYWCTQCHMLVCRDCLLFKHRDHTFLSLKDAATEIKVNLKKETQEINENKQNLTQYSTAIKNAITLQHQKTIQERNDIGQMFENLQRMLEERKCVLIKELEDKEIQSINILNQQQINIDQHLNLTTVQELCIRQILNSDDPIQILKFKSTLSHNYNDFIEEYRKIDKGTTIMAHIFKRNDKDFEDVKDMIFKLGNIHSELYRMNKDGVAIKTISLDISKISDNKNTIVAKEHSVARGYKFSLKQPMKLRSIGIQSDYNGSHVGFIVNDAGLIIHRGIANSNDSTMKRLLIPLEGDIKNDYTVLVCGQSGNGSFVYKKGDTKFRAINDNCAVQSKHIFPVGETNIGSKANIGDNTYSIDMILDIIE
ncbi:unnamed protein product [Adineta steineri]|uniref:Uncharacterized protein n=1 Tax=Adineta steineri TaxID=433720 RepID=A0A814XPY9_9BILA|nr:unnamed protein product [Adineta steineri]CAF1216914.1 unnamed protein product [Adineta steineri]CAF3884903.1 unnamed protein product [Adineta steineri]CAF4114476.1 unnamed protein product [Adineta steineri]